MRKIIVTAVIVAMAIFALPSTANAGGCLIKMQTADQLKSEKPTLIDFEKRITSATGYWNTYGVKFTSENGVGAYVNSYNRGGVIGAPTASGLYALANHPYSGKTSANDPLKITFKDPVNAFGLYYGNTFKVDQVTFTFFNQDGVELCSDSVPYTWANTSAAVIESRAVTNFYGINTWFDFYAVTIDFGSSTNREMIDDVMFLKSNTNVRYCTETDRGNDINIKATTTIFNAKGTQVTSETDTCIDSKKLREAVCNGSNIDLQEGNCGNGYSCVEGACVVDKAVVTGGGGGGGAARPITISQQDLLNLGARVIDFEDKTIDPITGYWDTYGVKFTSVNGKAIYVNSYNRGGKAKDVPTASGEYSLANNANKGQTSYNQPLKITFKEPVKQFGFHFGNAQNVKIAVVKFYDQNGELIYHYNDVIRNYQDSKYLNVFGKPVTTFVGYQSGHDIYSVTLDYGPVYNSESIDDFMFVPANHAPEFITGDIWPAYLFNVDTDGEFYFGATDTDNDDLSFYADGLPAGATFSKGIPKTKNILPENVQYGILKFSPVAGQEGNREIVLHVTDGKKVSSVTINIEIKNEKPQLWQMSAWSVDGKITLPDGTDGGWSVTNLLGTNGNTYQKTKNYVQPTVLNVAPTVNNLLLNFDVLNPNGSLTYKIVQVPTLGFEGFTYSENTAKTYAGYTGINGNAVNLGSNYRGKYIPFLGYMSNNDGVSDVPNMPVEVDDVVPMYFYFVDSTKLDIVGNNVTYLDKNILSGAQDVEVNKFKLKATNSDVKIKQLGFMVLDENGEQVSTNLGAIAFASLYDENNVLIGASPMNGTIGNIGFTNLNYVISKDTVKYLTIKLNMINFYSGYEGKKFTVKLTGGEIVDAVTDSTVEGTNLILTNTLSPVWTLISSGYLVVDLKTDMYLPSDKAYILAGTNKYVGQLQFRANMEDVKVRSLFLNGYGTGTENDFGLVELVNESGLVVASTNFTSNIKFSDLNYIVPKNSYSSLFIRVSANGITNQSPSAISGNTISFKMSGVEAEGVSSGVVFNLLSAGSNPDDSAYPYYGKFFDAVDSTTEVEILGAVLNNVFVSPGYGNGILTPGNGKILGVYNLTADNLNNLSADGTDIKVILGNAFRVTFEKSDTVGLSNLVVKTTIDNGNTTVQTVPVNIDENGVATFDMTTLGSDCTVDEFLQVAIVGDVTVTNNEGEYVRTKIADLSKDIKWGDGITTVTDSRFPFYSAVTGQTFSK